MASVFEVVCEDWPCLSPDTLRDVIVQDYLPMHAATLTGLSGLLRQMQLYNDNQDATVYWIVELHGRYVTKAGVLPTTPPPVLVLLYIVKHLEQLVTQQIRDIEYAGEQEWHAQIKLKLSQPSCLSKELFMQEWCSLHNPCL